VALAAARRIRAWLGRRGAELRLSLRMTVAGLLAFALAELLGLAQGYWAVLTAVIVVQASIGGSLKAGIDRLVGTLGGAAYGALVGLLVPHAEPVVRGAALALSVAPLALLATLKASFRVAPITAVIVLLGGAAQQDGPLASAIGRVTEIGLGCIVGLGVSLLVLPARPRTRHQDGPPHAGPPCRSHDGPFARRFANHAPVRGRSAQRPDRRRLAEARCGRQGSRT